MQRLLCLVSVMDAGGAETFLMKVYRELDRTKYQMDFCVNKFGKGFYDDEIHSLGGQIFHIPSKSTNIKEFKKQLTEIVKVNKYTHVLRITSNAMGFMDLKIAKKAGAKVAIARSSNSGDAEGIVASISHIVGRILFNRYIDVKVAPSDLAAKYTFGGKAYANGDVEILRNGLDLNIYRYNEADRNRIREELKIQSKFVIGHVGRFSEQKNHKFLIDLFFQYQKINEDSVLLLVGDGPLKGSIKKYVCDKGLSQSVLFTGIRKDIPQLLSAMDIFLLPSLYEGMPNTVIEAQATGLPCLISNTITREADITGLVQFYPIDPDSYELWLSAISNKQTEERDKYTFDMKNSGYSIDDVVKSFVDLCY